MANFALAQRSAALVSNMPAWEARSTANNKSKLLQVELTIVLSGSSTGDEFGIGRPSAVGVSPTSPQVFVDEEDGNAPAAFTTGCVAWGTAPTSPQAFNRRYAIQNNGPGPGVCAYFPSGLGIGLSNSIVVWTIAVPLATQNIDIGAVVSE